MRFLIKLVRRQYTYIHTYIGNNIHTYIYYCVFRLISAFLALYGASIFVTVNLTITNDYIFTEKKATPRRRRKIEIFLHFSDPHLRLFHVFVCVALCVSSGKIRFYLRTVISRKLVSFFICHTKL